MAPFILQKKYLKNIFSFSIVSIFSFVIFSFFAVISPFSIAPVQAADSSGLELNYPEILGNKPETIATGLPEYVKYIFDFAVVFAGLIALGSLIWGGFIYFTSSGDPMKIKSAKEQMTASFTGLLILFSSYLILATINPNLVSLQILPLPESGGIATPDAQIFQNPNLKVSAIYESLPLGKSMNDDNAGVFGKNKFSSLTLTINELDQFMKERIDINDPDLASNNPSNFFGLGKLFKTFANLIGGSTSSGNATFDRVSDLMKYLKTLTDGCFCNNIRAFCAKPEAGAQPIGCDGDPCQTEQSNGVESDSPRAKIDQVLTATQKKIKDHISWQKKIDRQKIILRESLRNFQEVETGISACQNQGADISPLGEYLETKQHSEEYGDKILEIPNSRVNSQDDPLSFYCAKGGNIFDSLHIPESDKESSDLEARLEQAEQYESGQGTSEAERLACPIIISTGGTLDQLRETAIVNILQLERASDLFEQIVKQIQKMVELVSQCNDKSCKPSCACVPNPCYLCCSPIPCTICVPFCKSKCLQGVGTCQGDACPREAIAEKSIQIKETEDQIFDTIDQLNKTFPQISSLLNGSQNPNNLKNVSSAINLCRSPNANEIETNSWTLMSCSEAKGSYNSFGQLIENCNPRDFYCCAITNQDIADMSLPLPTDESPVYIVPSKQTTPLPAVNGCPKGWLCDNNIKTYNQYDYASEPLKQLLSCARTKLDAFQKSEGLKATEILGKISFITDPKLYGNNNTCDWLKGPLIANGCSHTYNTKYGLERISAHYGGIICRYDHLSYAFDLDFSDNLQKQYAEKIIKSIKECDPGAIILDEVNRVHIGISESDKCNSNE